MQDAGTQVLIWRRIPPGFVVCVLLRVSVSHASIVRSLLVVRGDFASRHDGKVRNTEVLCVEDFLIKPYSRYMFPGRSIASSACMGSTRRRSLPLWIYSIKRPSGQVISDSRSSVLAGLCQMGVGWPAQNTFRMHDMSSHCIFVNPG